MTHNLFLLRICSISFESPNSISLSAPEELKYISFIVPNLRRKLLRQAKLPRVPSTFRMKAYRTIPTQPGTTELLAFDLPEQALEKSCGRRERAAALSLEVEEGRKCRSSHCLWGTLSRRTLKQRMKAPLLNLGKILKSVLIKESLCCCNG